MKKTIPVLLKSSSQVLMGVKVEQEHRQTIIDLIQSLKPDIDEKELNKLVNKTILNIGKDHLKENSTYYTKLAKIEETF